MKPATDHQLAYLAYLVSLATSLFPVTGASLAADWTTAGLSYAEAAGRISALRNVLAVAL